MKNILEHLASIIIILILFMVFSSATIAEVQIKNARKIHSAALSQIQASYYTIDINEMNAILADNYPAKDEDGNNYWYLETERLDSMDTRENYLVRLHYVVNVPFIGLKKTGIIEGQTRWNF